MSCKSQWGDACSPSGFCSNESAFWVSCATLHALSGVANIVAILLSRFLSDVERRVHIVIISINLCFIIVGSLEGSATVPGERSIGIDPATTVFFVIGGSLYWAFIEVQLYVQMRINPFPMGLQKVKGFRRAHKISLPFQMVTSTLGFLILFGMIADPANAYAYGAVHYLLLGILICVVCCLLLVSLTVILGDVRKAVVSSAEHQHKLERILSVLRNLRFAVIAQLVSSGSISFAFGLSTQLMRKSPYFLALIWSTITLPLMAHGASSIAVSRHRWVMRNGFSSDHAMMSDNQQIISPKMRKISTPGSAKQSRHKRKQWKGIGLSKVDEGNLVSTSEEAIGARSE